MRALHRRALCCGLVATLFVGFLGGPSLVKAESNGLDGIVAVWLALAGTTAAAVMSVLPLYLENFLKVNPETILFPETVAGLRALASERTTGRLEAVSEQAAVPAVGFEGCELR